MNKNVDVMIHTETPLTEKQFDDVAEQVRSIKGVSRFDRNDNLPKVIMVNYDPDDVQAAAILGKVSDLGVGASLVAG